MRDRIELKTLTVREALVDFYRRRIVRILPIYYLVLLAFTALSLVMVVPGFTGWPAVSYWTHTTNFYIAHINGWTGPFSHLWTLAIEEQFYLVMAPLALLLPRRALPFVCGALMLLGVVTLTMLEISGASDIQIQVASLPNFMLMAAGGLAGLASDHVRLPHAKLIQNVLLTALIVVPLTLHFSQETVPSWGVAIASAGAILVWAVKADQETAIVKWLEWPPLSYLGQISYGFYLYHNLVPGSAVSRLLGMAGLNAFLIVVATKFLITLAVSAASWKFIEQPLLRYRAKPKAAEASLTSSPTATHNLDSNEASSS